MREVQLEFPKGDVHLLRQLPGFEGFNATLEVIMLLKALWGLKDAPRAFGLRLAKSMKELGLKQTLQDPMTYTKHSGKQLVCHVSTHIGDLKGAAEEQARAALITVLRRDYGNDVKCQLNNFEHTGIIHEQSATTKAVYTHQNHHVREL